MRTLRRFSSPQSGEGLTNDCSDGVSPDSSYNPELNCFLPLDNEIDFAGLEGFEGLIVDNTKSQKIVSSSRWSRCTKRRLPPAEGAR